MSTIVQKFARRRFLWKVSEFKHNRQQEEKNEHQDVNEKIPFLTLEEPSAQRFFLSPFQTHFTRFICFLAMLLPKLAFFTREEFLSRRVWRFWLPLLPVMMFSSGLASLRIGTSKSHKVSCLLRRGVGVVCQPL